MADKATDLVISYSVHYDGSVHGNESLEKALAEGYRVVDVISTAATLGGESTGCGHCVVTVLLTDAKSSIEYCRART